MAKVHLIGFMTQGEPYDQGEDLTKSSALIKYANDYRKAVDTFTVYTTETAIKEYPEFKQYIQSYPEYDYGVHSRGCNHGFWKWKPFLILKHLQKIKEGDLLMYHDSNTDKYTYYVIDVGNLKKNIQTVLANDNLVAPIEDPFDPVKINKNFTKKEVFEQLISDTSCVEAPIMRCNRIFIRKNKLTVNFIENWLKLCDTSLLLPPKEEPLKWHTHDQAIFNALYHKYVQLRLFKQPTLYLKDEIFSKDLISSIKRQEIQPNNSQKKYGIRFIQ
jgi:hypothetical protein